MKYPFNNNGPIHHSPPHPLHLTPLLLSIHTASQENMTQEQSHLTRCILPHVAMVTNGTTCLEYNPITLCMSNEAIFV